MIIVSMVDSKLLRMEANGTLSEVADYKHLMGAYANDGVVAEGRAYVGNSGKRTGTNLVVVDLKTGESRIAAPELDFCNGVVITPDGKTLIIAETFGGRLRAFDIDKADGSLSNKRTWAQPKLPAIKASSGLRAGPFVPDGMCLDEEGGIWVANPVNYAGVVRVEEGGKVTHQVRVSKGRQAYACMLGGADGNTLFICTAKTSNPKKTHTMGGCIEAIQVHVRRAGWP